MVRNLVLSLILLALPAGLSAQEDIQSQPDIPTHAAALEAFEAGDMDTALEQARGAGELGNMDAMALAGYIQTLQAKNAVQLTEARAIYEIAADAGNTDAMIALADMGLAGKGGLNPDDAKVWLTKAATAPDPRADAHFALYQHYLGNGEAGLAESHLLSAANGGWPEAMETLGWNMLVTDRAAGLEWLAKAGEAGRIDAAYEAGLLLADSDDAAADPARGHTLLLSAAKSGHAPAMTATGLSFYQGRAGAPDVDAAAKWFEIAASAGEPEGMYLWAFALTKGEGTSQDFGEAFYWLLSMEPGEDADLRRDRDRLIAALEANVPSEKLSFARLRVKQEKARAALPAQP